MALEWQPRYPDLLLRRARRLPEAYTPRGGTSPIPIPSPPTELTWQSWYPAQAWGRHLPTAVLAGGVFPLSSVLVPFLWWPTAPDRLPHPRPAVFPATAPFQLGAILDLPLTGGWRPRFPDRLRRLAALPASGAVWIVSPDVLLGAVLCIELTDETVVSPQLTAEAVVSPSLTDETFTSPTLAEEDLC